jgi:hypothetical protein
MKAHSREGERVTRIAIDSTRKESIFTRVQSRWRAIMASLRRREFLKTSAAFAAAFPEDRLSDQPLARKACPNANDAFLEPYGL